MTVITMTIFNIVIYLLKHTLKNLHIFLAVVFPPPYVAFLALPSTHGKVHTEHKDDYIIKIMQGQKVGTIRICLTLL